MELSLGSFLAFGFVGGPEIVVILVVILLLFGAKLIPRLVRGIARSPLEYTRAKRSGGIDSNITKEGEDA